MKVCSPQLGVDPASHLGGAVYDYHLLRSLGDAGVDIRLLLPTGERYSQHPRWTVTRTRRHRWSYYEYNWIFRQALARVIENESFDLVRVHSPYSVGIGLLSLQARIRRPFVLHYYHVEPRPLWTAVDRLTLRRYTHVIAISRATRDALVSKYRLPEAGVSVVYPGVSESCTPLPPGERARSRAHGDVVGVHVGAFIPRKNLSCAIRITRALHDAGIAFRLVLVGSGPEELRLRSEAAELGVADRVEFHVEADEQRKLALLRNADLYVHVSALEGFGMAAVEAMACGLPVVTFDRAPGRELVHDGVTGILVSPVDDPEAAAEAIRFLAEHPGRLRALGDAASREAAERFSWRRCAAETLRVYECVL